MKGVGISVYRIGALSWVGWAVCCVRSPWILPLAWGARWMETLGTREFGESAVPLRWASLGVPARTGMTSERHGDISHKSGANPRGFGAERLRALLWVL